MTYRQRLAAALLALTVAAVAACSRPADDFGEHDHDHGTGVPSGASIAPLPPLPAPWTELDRNDPQTVAVAAVTALFDWRPADGDTGPETAVRRAKPLLTPRAAQDYRPYPVPRQLWEQWMDRRAEIRTTTEVSSEQHPVDTDVTWQRKLVTRIDADGTAPFTAATLVTVTKQPVWTVTAVTTMPT
ncbi:hypothetical protein [Nocardia farcinica]|uniref:hypothetical protein n=1 Tax=Nocardia farcinica TaxID=37329 RepID=UPI0024558F69|nr:hypothetical protein [Nocardia farcinica]